MLAGYVGGVEMVLMVTGHGVMGVKCWGLVFNVVYFGAEESMNIF